MTTALKLIWFLFWFMPGVIFCQVTFHALPEDLQLLPRSSDNFGRFTIKGLCTDTDAAYLEAQILNAADSQILDQTRIDIRYNEHFELPVKLKAQLIEYNIHVWYIDKNGNRSLATVIKNLVAGDIYFAAGQSNAVANIFDEGNYLELDSLYAHKCCRTIGQEYSTALKSRLPMRQDAKFKRPSSGIWDDLSAGFVGVWELKLQYELATKSGIPNCMINCSQGASAIARHLPKKTPTDGLEILNGKDSISGPGSMYERLFMKTFLNNLNKEVRGIFWYQGESDGDSPDSISIQYQQRFSVLYNAWKKDYPGVKRIFLFQINTGCGGDNLQLVRDQQMRIADQYDDVTVMTTVGGSPEERAEDGCHFKPYGYMRIADNMSLPVLKYIYNHDLQEKNILPPRLVDVYYSSVTELCLRFDKNVFVQDSAVYKKLQNRAAYLSDYFYDMNDSTLPVKSIRSSGDCVFLGFDESHFRIGTVSYLPAIFSKIPSVYDGPWILNDNNKKIAAFPIYNFPVSGINLAKDYLIYPNPNTGEFSVRSTTGNYVTQVLIHDCLGHILYASGKIKAVNHFVNVDLPDGMYALSVTHAGVTTVRKVLLKKED